MIVKCEIAKEPNNFLTDILNNMTIYNSQLKPPLSQYIQAIFYYKDFMPDHSIERVVPTGHIFLIFELDDFPRHTYDNQNLQIQQTFTKVWISGVHQNYISISAHQKSAMFVIQFKPYGAYPFLPVSVQDLTEKICPADKIFGEEILNLRTTILKAETPVQKFTLAQKWLEEQRDKNKKPTKEFIELIDTLEKAPASQFNQVLENYRYTPKHLISQFKKYLGLRPKYYQRILRFNEILQKMKKKEMLSWSQIAYSCGYSDQSHFIKEFKHFSGFNPEAFIQQPFPSDRPNFFPLD